MKDKPWWKSKTVYASIVTFINGIAMLLVQDFPEQKDTIIRILAYVNLVAGSLALKGRHDVGKKLNDLVE